MAARLPINRFSTDRFAPHERHEAWLHRNWPSFGSAVDAIPQGPFTAFSEEVGLGEATVFFGSFSPQTIRRTPKHIRTDGLNSLYLGLNLSGEVLSSDYDVPAGGMVMLDMSLEMQHFSSDCRLATVALPRSKVLAVGIEPRQYHNATFDASKVSLLRSHLLQLRRSAPNLAANDGPALLRTIIDLLAVSINDSGRPLSLSQDVADVGARAKASALIEQHIGDAALNVDILCQLLGTSRSSLYRLFDEVGGVHTYIRNRRLELIRQALIDFPVDPIADVAARLGFNDAAHFSRAFRQRFGLSPREFRALTAREDRY